MTARRPRYDTLSFQLGAMRISIVIHSTGMNKDSQMRRRITDSRLDMITNLLLLEILISLFFKVNKCNRHQEMLETLSSFQD